MLQAAIIPQRAVPLSESPNGPETATNVRPAVALVGRPNVGKSSLFNRIIGKRQAIVEDLPGTTRDRLYADSSWEGKEFTLVDTGGLDPRPSGSISRGVRQQVDSAIAEADLVLMLVDAREGLTASDWDVAESLRKASKPVILVANKADHPKYDIDAADFNRLGFGEPIPVSAHHGRGVQDVLDKAASKLPRFVPEAASPDYVKIAIVGRPNVGKSMLINTLTGEERAVVSEIPGTTRDSLDTLYRNSDRQALLIDTAGVRRRGQVEAGIEYYSVLRTLRAISRSDAALLVIDASEGVTAQDLHVAGYIKDACKGMVLIANKWDLVGPEQQSEIAQKIQEKFRFVAYAPVLYTSAKLRQGIEDIIPQAERIWQERLVIVPGEKLDRFLKRALERHGPPRSGTKQLKVYGLEQSGNNPPRFRFFVNDPEIVHFSYQRYLENSLRESFGFYGSPIVLHFDKRRRGASQPSAATGGKGVSR
ncbi:MAG: ribosome biogenesis GTPase Der [Chloroflexi bacterium]|nr:ribosome biogenesis GTPase Der [Chloroflexota bacterium]